ncbi:GH92 family glycosyl hydrolase [Virgibacillus salexigens]|uniref:Alpha-1 2-mannosidase n=1 Tax=Virgibacillus kapii TaxID=1638645 RepID=A0ABQ2DN27_9BACI|nr:MULTISPECIES: GH92 family glycosyl hydrolase [Virgibacillus]GGJ65072.1 alpha-1 2-mannosidase [Virgibacillus kapii]
MKFYQFKKYGRYAFFAILLTLLLTSASNMVTHGQEMDFFTSFEENDRTPTWENTVEVDREGDEKASGIDGNIDEDRIQGDITDKVQSITASANNPPNEIEEKLIDNDQNTKWLAFESDGWIEMELSEKEKLVKYAFTSANDSPERDPKQWSVFGSSNGEDWVEIDSRENQSFENRFERKIYTFENNRAYKYYRFELRENHSGDIIQLADIALSNGEDTPEEPPTDMKSYQSDGPPRSYTAKTNVGWEGLKAFTYEGTHLSKGRAYSYNKVYDVDIPVTAETKLSYFISPLFMDTKENDYSSTYASIDLAFSDGSYLSELGVKDQHGVVLHPTKQGNSNTLYPNQWNYKEAMIGEVAKGKTIKRILVAYDNPNGPTTFKGSVDNIKIGDAIDEEADNFTDYVNILRGTQSNGTFSRGNNIPAVAVPHGFNFWTPVTDAGSTSWLYSYHQDNNEENLPELEAFSVSHEPSPWMGDRQTFQVMPSSTEGEPTADRSERALAFQHKNEIAKPHYYKVSFENGIVTEMAPTNHAAMFRFTFPDNQSKLIFDNVNNNGGLSLHPESQSLSGYSDVKSGLSAGATRMFIYATFDKPIAESSKLPGNDRDNVAGYYKFDIGNSKEVNMKIATSLISVEQAKKNLQQEISQEDSLEDVKEKANQQWNDKLRRIEVEGANYDQLTTLYSNMYRLFLYPNIAYENVGSVAEPVYQYASPFSEPVGEDTPTETGAKVNYGKPYVNNGFWDTYRTAWPAYTLLTPQKTGEMIDGFVQHYKDGGWISRWSSPGYANLMVGTSSDIAFADAYTKGVKNFDVTSFYESALKNAAVVSPSQATGRKGLETSIFNGYTSTAISEGMSWSMDGYINDFGIANFARAMKKQENGTNPYYDQLDDDYLYFLNRSRQYRYLFNEQVQFFMGRAEDGKWRETKETFDPRSWGGDYTETNAWNMAFHAPHDGQGLANLYGGREGLANKLDAFFSTKETATYPGHYGGVIHEMREARDVRMGMYGHSNQPAHHIVYMYNYAGEPWKTQSKVREILSRQYIGSEIGQGYAGDEDNGEMSAWYLLSAAGIYPLTMGTGEYAIGAPFFEKMTIHLENGKDLEILAPEVSDTNKYIQNVTINGEDHNKLTISHQRILEGGTIEYEMGSEPSDWGTSDEALPNSIVDTKTDGTTIPLPPMHDLTDNNKYSGITNEQKRLFDNASTTEWHIDDQVARIRTEFTNAPLQAEMYTITSGEDKKYDPISWVLKGSNNGQDWKILDSRENESFKWRNYTRSFKIESPNKYSHYQLEITKNNGADRTTISEIELLGYDNLNQIFEQITEQLIKFQKAEDLNKGMADQIIHQLGNVEKHVQKGKMEQAIKQTRNLIQHIEKRKKQKKIDESVCKQIEADLYSLIQLIQQKK